MSKNTTIRFAFGTQDKPGSSVWRVNVVKSKGDIYIHNNPQFGSEVHIALHASGRFHLKLGESKHHLAAPWKDPLGLIWGPVIFFYRWERDVPPPKPTGNTHRIQWLGWPERDHLFLVKPTYSKLNIEVAPHANEFTIGDPVKSKLFGEEMMFHLFVEHRPMSSEELEITSKKPSEPVHFNGGLPHQMEMIRVAMKTSLGPSAVILERFDAIGN